MFYTNIDAAVH